MRDRQVRLPREDEEEINPLTAEHVEADEKELDYTELLAAQVRP